MANDLETDSTHTTEKTFDSGSFSWPSGPRSVSQSPNTSDDDEEKLFCIGKVNKDKTQSFPKRDAVEIEYADPSDCEDKRAVAEKIPLETITDTKEHRIDHEKLYSLTNTEVERCKISTKPRKDSAHDIESVETIFKSMNLNDNNDTKKYLDELKDEIRRTEGDKLTARGKIDTRGNSHSQRQAPYCIRTTNIPLQPLSLADIEYVQDLPTKNDPLASSKLCMNPPGYGSTSFQIPTHIVNGPTTTTPIGYHDPSYNPGYRNVNVSNPMTQAGYDIISSQNICHGRIPTVYDPNPERYNPIPPPPVGTDPISPALRMLLNHDPQSFIDPMSPQGHLMPPSPASYCQKNPIHESNSSIASSSSKSLGSPQNTDFDNQSLYGPPAIKEDFITRSPSVDSYKSLDSETENTGCYGNNIIRINVDPKVHVQQTREYFYRLPRQPSKNETDEEYDDSDSEDEDGNSDAHNLAYLNDDEFNQRIEQLVTNNQFRQTMNEFNKKQRTPLYIAAICHNLAVFDFFLRNGADPTKVCYRKKGTNYVLENVLHLACEKGFVRLVDMLLRHGARDELVNSRSVGEDMTPLLLASTYYQNCEDHHYIEIIELLINCGADLKDKDPKSGRTTLMMLISKNELEFVSSLLDRISEDSDEDVRSLLNQTDRDLNTCCHMVAQITQYSHYRKVSVKEIKRFNMELIKHGADPELENRSKLKAKNLYNSNRFLQDH